MFSSWDPHDIGSISVERFVRGIRTLSPTLETGAANTVAAAVDSDGDGYIMRDQFVAWLLES
jgi:Ca2+-binding EF-hand superfamily protein